MLPLITDVGLLSHLVAAAAFAALAATLIYRRQESSAGRWLVIASLASIGWAIAAVAAAYDNLWAYPAIALAETLRSGTWIAFVGVLVISNWADRERNPSRRILAAVLLVVAAQLAVDTAVLVSGDPMPAWGGYIYTLGRLAVAIGGLVLTHNAFVNSAPANRWSIRLLCIALAGILGYDLNLYTLALLNGALNADLFEVRGIANALVVPLIFMSAARNRGLRLQVSRQAAFHTLSLGAIGVYLVAMSLAGYGLRLVGGDWGRLLQISFIFGTGVLAAVVLFSGRARAWLRVQINKHFFAYKYDYRQEWLRFLKTVSSSGPGMGELHMRVVQAVCEPVDSPGGALFLEADDASFRQIARWNYRTLRSAVVGPEARLAAYFASSGRIVNIPEYRAGGGSYGALELPSWLVDDPLAWLVIPLVHIDEPIGFILVERPLAQRELNWEDFDILRTVGRQAASYVAEAAALAKIAESRKFDEFNRRFAFIMHDIKNLVSQLSLVARNAERHADNPEFRKDMVATLQSSVTKMNDLLARLSQQSVTPEVAGTVDLARAAANVVRAAKPSRAEVALIDAPPDASAQGQQDKVEQVLTHLVQNAIDASPSGSPVEIAVERCDGSLAVSVRDHGRGMTADFIRGELFEPFKSTKIGGFGIGAFEAREIIKEMGGKLAVESEPGVGSCFTMYLPAVADARADGGRDG